MPAVFPDPKGPYDTLDYQANWAKFLAGGDTIVSSTWAGPAALTIASHAFTETTTTVWVGGGQAKTSYNLVNTITTTAGRTVARTFVLKVAEA